MANLLTFIGAGDDGTPEFRTTKIGKGGVSERHAKHLVKINPFSLARFQEGINTGRYILDDVFEKTEEPKKAKTKKTTTRKKSTAKKEENKDSIDNDFKE